MPPGRTHAQFVSLLRSTPPKPGKRNCLSRVHLARLMVATARKRPALGSRPRFPHLSEIREVNLVGGNGKSPSVAAILLGRRQAEEIAKTRAPPHQCSSKTHERSRGYCIERCRVVYWGGLLRTSPSPIMEVCQSERITPPPVRGLPGRAFCIDRRCCSIGPWWSPGWPGSEC